MEAGRVRFLQHEPDNFAWGNWSLYSELPFRCMLLYSRVAKDGWTSRCESKDPKR